MVAEMPFNAHDSSGIPSALASDRKPPDFDLVFVDRYKSACVQILLALAKDGLQQSRYLFASQPFNTDANN
jgi:hypothetical protein